MNLRELDPPYVRNAGQALRHTWISDALIRGVDPVTVATIAGHDPVMTMKIYAHLHLNAGHLREALARATGEAPPLIRTA